ncbi:MAG: sulfate ABC transporter permease subunit [Actinobacteria bacterium]|nr:sulfate ABC transporter permease subunit [Actinomycetota bacterium]MCL5887733.1 sulfate ABC transporter permease subunit [Actinomycetota bacterium]
MADAQTVRGSPSLVRRVLIGLAITWLLAALALPIAILFTTAFSEGWQAFVETFGRPDLLHAKWLTLLAVLGALVVNLLFGLTAGWTVARTKLPGRRLVSMLLDLSIVVPPVIAGLMILLLYGRRGWFGTLLESADIKVVFALPAIVLATIFVTLPFVAKEVISVLEETGENEENAAATLGASRMQTFFLVVLPNLKWALFYGIVLTVARALGEFGGVLVVSGNLIGKTQTLPLFIEHAYTNYETVAAFAAAVPLAVAAALTLFVKGVVAAVERRLAEDSAIPSEGRR